MRNRPSIFLRRLLLDPGAVFAGTHHAARHPAAAAAPETPLVDVPMPRLRPTIADAVPTLAYQETPTPVIPAPADSMPLPHVSPRRRGANSGARAGCPAGRRRAVAGGARAPCRGGAAAAHAGTGTGARSSLRRCRPRPSRCLT
ncbi:MAG: hypothetical protein WDM84_06740 [Bauldia sp.]